MATMDTITDLWPTTKVEIVPLNSPAPGRPLWHNLTCGRCGWHFSHTDRTVIHCGLCRMDEVNFSYQRRYAKRLV